MIALIFVSNGLVALLAYAAAQLFLPTVTAGLAMCNVTAKKSIEHSLISISHSL